MNSKFVLYSKNIRIYYGLKPCDSCTKSRYMLEWQENRAKSKRNYCK
jgi:hypothetical protein